MKGSRIAVLGLGRSGLSIAIAARNRGADVIVFDEKTESSLPKRDVLDEARECGIAVRLGEPFRLPISGSWNPEILVTNPAVPKWHDGLQDAAGLGVEVLSEVEFAYRISPAPIIAITGTNGKSTTTVMTYLCLRACDVDAVLCGNIFGSGYPEMTLTDAAASATPDQVLVAEISSFQLEWVSSFKPVAAAVTNITPDHLDRYHGFDDYASTKLRVFSGMDSDGLAIAGQGVPNPETDAKFLQVPASFEGETLELGSLNVGKDSLPFSGAHNYANAWVAAHLSAAALGQLDNPPECIAEGLQAFSGLAHRMERLGSRSGVAVINNSMCTNPAAVAASASSVDGKKHLLVGGANKDLNFEPLRSHLEQSRDVVYLFGSDAQNLRNMLASGGETYRTMEEAFKAATDQAKPGESIMLAPGCASTDQFRDFRHRGDVFKALAMEWLNS